MTRRVVRAAAGLVLLWSVSARPASGADLAAVRDLYIAANYEEALAALSTVEGAAPIEDVQQIRALCLLALGRAADAEAAVRELVLRSPGHRVDPASVSPKFVELFNEVRGKTLPSAVRAMYAQAKARYDARDWPAAGQGFSRLLTLLGEPGITAADPTLSDLKQLGEGFQRLVDVELASLEAARKAEAEAAAKKAEAARVPPPPDRTIYAMGDAGVTPPKELQLSLPRWAPANPLLRTFTATGTIEVVISETGAVERATIVKPTAPAYDDELLRNSRSWRFQPATKGDQPVRFRHLITVVLRPPPQ